MFQSTRPVKGATIANALGQRLGGGFNPRAP